MEIADAACKHGIHDLDIGHAVRNAIRVVDQGDRDLYIGADRTGRLLETSSSMTTANRWPSMRWSYVASSTTSSEPIHEVMMMPRTREQLQQAADDAERWLDSLDPAAVGSPDADATHLRRIGGAVRAASVSQTELADAVAAAREHGHSWTQIATMLGTSRQAAQERYGKAVPQP